ncbi:hypothetical protein FM038_020870 [Shewanella eurypsychrophilus]|uniref:DUF6351 domain-containing protein n=1 Tax=Shewanella eurypsychrophilus TaxID=2593656 RepID=A0ABX6VC13_9GAMM|nr:MULTISPECIES: DUF6351 family protein [Shewanella]QFU24359.1 hypothetical protein FS418_22575 [Shewanella sp. YLB-09]QPG59559.1 hypothetical protein FM038_020870 [Shewanella eurypsychrophilus]
MNRSILLLLLVSSGFLVACGQDPLVKRQVISIAPMDQKNQILQIDKHISLTARPEETFAFPIPLGKVGPADSLYSGKRQYPFYCMTLDAGIGQPLVDNQQGYGVAVYDKNDKVIGYSKDCMTISRIDYFYTLAGTDKILPYDLKMPPAREKIATTHIEGKPVPEIFRLERGSINRYIYFIAMLVPETSLGDRDAKQYWNNKLIYQFKGGASIGFRQGQMGASRFINRRHTLLRQGYAVIGSSGNNTSYSYNMLLAEDTARRVKSQFISLYGEPLYTLGIGGSGGGLAQYLIAQNSTGVLDGLMPIYSYPDMVSQSIFILDCDLLQHYFNITDNGNSKWKDWEQRENIEGMNGINGFEHPYTFLVPLNQMFAGAWPSMPNGSSECVYSWFIASTFFYNPKQGFVKPYFSDEVKEQVNWTYWQDLAQIYGTDDNGFARTTWGNEGVQYGLKAMQQGDISIDEFIHLNQYIGSWVPQDKMRKETAFTPLGMKFPIWLSLWGRNNITEPKSHVAKRKPSDPKAIDNGYRYGQVFIGKAEVPILEIRHYLEEDLNMHHTLASFEARLRMLEYQGHNDNQVIWISHKDHTPIDKGIAFLDQWLLARRNSEDKDPVMTKPLALVDSCIDEQGNVQFEGDNVWDGEWNNKPAGKCSKIFPTYSNIRVQAGGPWAGSIFKCGRVSISDAIEGGIYGDVPMQGYQQKLENIFPSGVCDYTQGDIAKPDLGLTPSLQAKKNNRSSPPSAVGVRRSLEK